MVQPLLPRQGSQGEGGGPKGTRGNREVKQNRGWGGEEESLSLGCTAKTSYWREPVRVVIRGQ